MINEARLPRLQEKYRKKNEKYIKQMEEDAKSGKSNPRVGRGPGAQNLAKVKPKNAMPSIKRLFGYMKQDAWKIAIVLVLVLIYTASSLAGSYVLRPVINSIAGGNGTVKILAEGIALMAAIYATGIVAQYLQQRIMISISQRALAKIRNELYEKISKLPLKYYDTNNHGDIMSRFTNDVDS
ncbi:MAG: ABC transporter ATP-binding protein, partial [Lachnospiraceae bacterium]|nr:ABC transporter ATP-binding protein [Lachnospiraceae bacterium]